MIETQFASTLQRASSARRKVSDRQRRLLRVEDVLTTRGRKWKRRLDVPVILSALMVLPLLIFEQQLGDSFYGTLWLVDWVLWSIIALEFLFILRITPNRKLFVRRSWVDSTVIVLTFPAVPNILVGLGWVEQSTAIELLELLLLLRLALVVVRVKLGPRRLFGAFGLGYGMALLFFLVVTGGSLLSLEEDRSLAEGIWWAVVTVSTVGYGDVVPDSPIGRVLAAVLILLGISFVALLTGSIAARVSNPVANREREEFLAEFESQRMRSLQIQDQLTKLADQLEDQDVSTEVRNLTERLADLEHQVGSNGNAA